VKTYSMKDSDISRDWYVVDASGQTLGRLSSKVAAMLRGKHKPTFTPWLDTGDYVIIINAEKIKVTGNREAAKRVLIAAIKGMLPHNRLGRKMIKKLKIYAGAEHPHGAQQPKPLEL
jgi:large subunit ribosomal protein L13